MYLSQGFLIVKLMQKLRTKVVLFKAAILMMQNVSFHELMKVNEKEVSSFHCHKNIAAMQGSKFGVSRLQRRYTVVA